MAFDHRKLKGKIREIFGTQTAFADAMGLSCTSISAKLNGHTVFSQDEIYKASRLLGIPFAEIDAYFFTLEV